MYLDFKVKIPSDSAGITRKKIKGTTYIYYAYEHNYSSEKDTLSLRVHRLESAQMMIRS